jgi:Predicted membrane protein
MDGKKSAKTMAAAAALKTIVVGTGLALISLGVVLCLRSGLGVDSFTVFYSGVAKTVGISIGRALQVCMFALLIVVALVDRRQLGLGTVLHAILIGTFTDFLLGKNIVPAMRPLALAIPANIAGIALFGFGSAVYIKAGMGVGAIDAAMLILHAKTGKDIKRVRIGINFLLAAFGYVLGGDLGIGTVLSVFATGPMIELSLRGLDALFPCDGTILSSRSRPPE